MEIIVTHNNLDFDALASLVCGQLLYPGAVPVLPRHVNPNTKAFLSIHKEIFHFESINDIDPAEVRRVIVVDANRWSRLDKMAVLGERRDLEVVLWDHHAADDADIQAAWSCQEQVGATVTLMLRAVKEKNILLTPILATLFLAGIYEDTGNLTFTSATSEDAFAAGYLLERKADLTVVNTFLRQAYGEEQKNILFEMLQKAERDKLAGYSVSFNTVAIKGYTDRLSLVVHMYREILDVDAAFGIFQAAGDRCIVIGRSDVDGIHVGSIMRSMGGGGHPGAGSAVIKQAHPEAVVEWLRELIAGNQQSSVRVRDLMSYPVLTAAAAMKMREVNVLLDERGCTGIPVVEDDKLVGILSRRDFNKVKKQSQLDAPAKAFMSRTVQTVSPDKSPMQAARIMVQYDIGRLPVVEDGALIGIVTRSDVMAYFYDMLPG